MRSVHSRWTFPAGVAQDAGRAAALATALGVDADALQTILTLAPVPLLRACAARWANRVSPAWSRGFCPVCGAWPTLGEARGLERARRLRCGRCAADWPTVWLRCVYCDTDDHARLGSLVLTTERSAGTAPEPARVATSIDTCAACRGYLKTVATLTPTPAEDLGLLDLSTLELDVAALEQGYARPPGVGAVADARVVTPAGGRAGWWRA